MMLLSRNTCLALLWGVSALFSVESLTDTTPQTSGTNSTAEPNDATTQLNSYHVLHYESQTLAATPALTREPVATAETAASNATETQEADVRSTGYGSNVSATASSWPRVSTSATKATPSHNKTTSDATEPGPTTSARMTPPATTTLMALTSSAASSASAALSSLQSSSTAGPQATRGSSSTAGPQATRGSSSTAGPEATRGSSSTAGPQATRGSSSTAGPQATRGSSSTAGPQATRGSSSTAGPEATRGSSSTAGPEATRGSSSTNSSAYLTHTSPSTQNVPTASASTVHANTTNRTGAAPALDPTSLPEMKPETATARAELSSVPQPVSHDQTPTSTSRPPDITRLASPATSGSVTAFSTSPAGIFIRPGPSLFPVLTTKSAAPTAPAPKASQSPSTTEAQSCSRRDVVTRCLIIIASLAGLATIFMVSTIVLCAKLSMRKHKARKPKQETEMMCISALLPERNHNYTRQHNPVPNGILVLPTWRDSDDDDIGDNLTLSSFLPENERIV